MNEDRIKGNWKQFTGKIREQWGKLTDDDLDVIAGKREQFWASCRNARAWPATLPKSS
jgi:uncharacterized protein YjbJ (UPF0337 family)